MSEAIPPLTQYVFMVWCLVKHNGNFTFTFMTLKDSIRLAGHCLGNPDIVVSTVERNYNRRELRIKNGTKVTKEKEEQV